MGLVCAQTCLHIQAMDNSIIICMHNDVCVYMYTNTHTYIYAICTYLIHVKTYIYLYIYTHMYIYVSCISFIHLYMYIYICIDMYVYMHSAFMYSPKLGDPQDQRQGQVWACQARPAPLDPASQPGRGQGL